MRLALALALAGLLLLALAACNDDDERKPMPVVTVQVLRTDNAYLLDGRPLGMAALQDELVRIADANRRTQTGNVRAYVRIATESGANWNRVQDVVEVCQRAGFQSIQTEH